MLPVFANSLHCWRCHQNWASQQGRKFAKSGSNNFFFQFCQSYSYVNRKVWCHQIWIPNNLGFMVLILIYMQIFQVPNIGFLKVRWTADIISTHKDTSWEVVLTRRLITSWYLSRAEAESVLLGHKAKGVKHDGRCLQTGMQLHQFCKQITNSYYMDIVHTRTIIMGPG